MLITLCSLLWITHQIIQQAFCPVVLGETLHCSHQTKGGNRIAVELTIQIDKFFSF